MDKLNFYSDDIFKDKLQRLAEIFPECVTESDDNGNTKKSFNFDLLKEILAENISDDPERYNFIWAGKSRARDIAGKKTFKTLRPCRAESVNWDDTQNLYIEGENLDVLKILRSSYSGKVKLIYIDPPYNTGNDFIYRDAYKMNQADYDDAVNLRDADENFNFKKNPDSNPLIHSDWCSMIFPRLLLARELLADDGVIFISIDDNEQANLKKICDEVFGEKNYFAMLTRRSMHTVRNSSKDFNKNSDFVLVYGKNKEALTADKNFRIRETVDKSESYKFNDNDGRGFYKLDPIYARNYAKPYTFTFKNGIVWTAPEGSFPRYSQETLARMEKDNRLNFDGKFPRAKRYLEEVQEGQPPDTILKEDTVGFNSDGTKLLADILGNDKVFSQPKPIDFIKYLIEIIPGNTESIVLDFFSGSATTAHAVMALNAEDGGRRKFIMVQIPEPCAEDTEAYKAGYKNICEIGKERIRRAGSKIKAEMPLTTADIGFRVLKLDTSNFKDAYLAPEETTQDIFKGFEDIIKEDRTAEDLLFSSLIACGLELTKTYEVEEYKGAKLIDYGGGEMLACFDREITPSVIKYMAEKKPRRAVIRDDAFQRDADKINTDGIFKQISPSTRVKII